LRDAVTVNSLGTCTSRSAAETTEAIAFAVRVAGSTASAVTFEYSLPADSDVEFALYDIGGRRISTIERSQRTVGTYSAVWNTAGTPRGMYFYRLRAGSRVVSGALPLVR
jgi:hypothetical protein